MKRDWLKSLRCLDKKSEKERKSQQGMMTGNSCCFGSTWPIRHVDPYICPEAWLFPWI
jgi:hypothetical protein